MATPDPLPPPYQPPRYRDWTKTGATVDLEVVRRDDGTWQVITHPPAIPPAVDPSQMVLL